MDTDTIFHVLFSLVSFLGGFILKTVWEEQKEQRKAIQTLSETLTEKYVRKDDFRVFSDRVTTVLDRIEAKLDISNHSQTGHGGK